MASFLGIKNRVAGIIIDLPTFVQQSVGDLVNQAMRDLQDDHDFKVMEREVQIETVDGERVLDVDPLALRFKKFRNFPYEVKGLTNSPDSYSELFVSTSRDEVLRLYRPSTTGGPKLILDVMTAENGTRQWEVWPLPDDDNPQYTDGNYQIVVPYWGYVAPLAADGESNWFTDNAEWYLTFKAAANGFAMDWDYSAMAVWEQKAQMQMAKVVKADKMYRLGDVTTFAPRKGVYNPKLSGPGYNRWRPYYAL